ncbi:MAG: hypothetical protein ACUVQ1_06590 [Candidatus Kapaibacteriales bacterium]
MKTEHKHNHKEMRVYEQKEMNVWNKAVIKPKEKELKADNGKKIHREKIELKAENEKSIKRNKES